MSDLKLTDLAKRIGEHLRRFESDPVLSRRADGKSARFWGAACWVSGRYIGITYISYQGSSHLSKVDALAYLAKLDAGYVGRHFEALRGTDKQ